LTIVYHIGADRGGTTWTTQIAIVKYFPGALFTETILPRTGCPTAHQAARRVKQIDQSVPG
jgi:hypothetical protein